MKVKDIIVESMTFSAAKIEVQPDGRKVISSIGGTEDVECFVCDGNGQEKWGGDGTHKCDYCHGAGTVKAFKAEGPEMNVANSNGYEIMKMAGLEQDEYGHVAHADLPALMQRLMKLKNGDTSDYTRDPETSKGEMKRQMQSGNVTAIGRGPTMVDMGRSQGQVSGYIDRLMKIVQYAQKNNHDISWG